MNTRLVNSATGVLHAAMEQGTATAAGLAMALEAAQLLQSPESAAEVARLRKRVAELEAESVGIRETIAARIEQRGQVFLPQHPVWPYVPVFAGIARGHDVPPRSLPAAAEDASSHHEGPVRHDYRKARLLEDQ